MDTELAVSEETNAEQVDAAKRQGAALQHAVNLMNHESTSGVLVETAGDYEIGIAVENAEGLWSWEDDELVWHEPQGENCHVEVCVRDRASGRFIPMLDVHVTIVDSAGDEVGRHSQPFLWHPWLYHYGRNWKLPGSGSYSLVVEVGRGDFARHDHVNGGQFRDPVRVVFDDVSVTTGEKRS